MVIKDCQRFRDGSFLPQHLSHHFSNTFKLVEKCIGKTQDFIRYLNGLPHSDNDRVYVFAIGDICMDRLTKNIDLIMYYKSFFYKDLEAVSTYRNEKGTDILDRARSLVPYLSGILKTFIKLHLVLRSSKSAVLGESAFSNYSSWRNGSDVDSIVTVYKCIKKSLFNSNVLAPDNARLERDSPVGRRFLELKKLQDGFNFLAQKTRKWDDQSAHDLFINYHNEITAHIETKAKRVLEMTRNGYFEVVRIKQAAGNRHTVLYNNLNAYASQFEWVMNENIEEDQRRSEDLMVAINKEFDLLTEYGIRAEVQAMLS
ncbi:hypothetical protein AX774_g4791 [Zancudomyces culisetae]|uniref:Uncharacterized protein n=1 Tax=Zancudomyces culisetae TaxID=1213189 RepID=A0A1R1PLE2_ZANCU|nr:hypothetical protein AX774_g4791 [Zancudomyces culisetae]|eukprot:OMH81749.1 hypothetical protein AX774_g4791 [Zancudomyces culisetae]